MDSKRNRRRRENRQNNRVLQTFFGESINSGAVNQNQPNLGAQASPTALNVQDDFLPPNEEAVPLNSQLPNPRFQIQSESDEEEGAASESEAESNGQSHDSDEEHFATVGTDSDSDEEADPNETPFTLNDLLAHPEDYQMPLYEGAPISCLASYFTILQYCIQYHLSKVFLAFFVFILSFFVFIFLFFIFYFFIFNIFLMFFLFFF